MKKIALIIGILVAIGASIVGYFKWDNSSAINTLSIVPSDAAYIIQSSEPISNWQTFSSSEFWQFYQSHPSLKELSDNAEYLDKLITENATALKHIGRRNFIVSAHMIGNNDYDFITYFDLKDAAKLKLSHSLLARVVEDASTKLYEHAHNGKTVFEILDTKSKDMLYLCQVSNHLVFSYSKTLIHRCVDLKKNQGLPFDAAFVEMTNEVDNQGLCQLYINHSTLPDLVGYYSEKGKSNFRSLQGEFRFTGFDLKTDDYSISMNGFSAINEKSTYARLLQIHGNGTISFDKIVSQRSGYCQAFFFTNFMDFYTDLLPHIQTEEKVQSFQELQQKVEKVLDLSLEEDLLSWIGNEIVVAQHRPSEIHRNSEDDLIVAIRANKIDNATQRLMNIQKQIRRRTPATFTKLDYKNHSIYYLDIKGFFGLFFGKSFDQLTKPYYTVIEDFVVFSNSPKTLASMIEDYENGHTLINDAAYLKVKEELPSKHSIFTYVHGPNTYPIVRNKINAAERLHYAENKPYFMYLNATGISFSGSGNGFKNAVYMHFNSEVKKTPVVVLEEKLLFDETTNTDNLSDAELFVLHQINNGDYVKYYPNSDVAILTVETKNGLFHGKYRSFYPSGVLKAEGRYRKGKKFGRWKYYSTDGQIEEKKWE